MFEHRLRRPSQKNFLVVMASIGLVLYIGAASMHLQLVYAVKQHRQLSQGYLECATMQIERSDVVALHAYDAHNELFPGEFARLFGSFGHAIHSQYVRRFWFSIVNGCPETLVVPVHPGSLSLSVLYRDIFFDRSPSKRPSSLYMENDAVDIAPGQSKWSIIDAWANYRECLCYQAAKPNVDTWLRHHMHVLFLRTCTCQVEPTPTVVPVVQDGMPVVRLILHMTGILALKPSKQRVALSYNMSPLHAFYAGKALPLLNDLPASLETMRCHTLYTKLAQSRTWIDPL